MNAIVSALSAENEGEGKAPPGEHDHLFYHSMNYSANILLRRGGIWYLVFETKTTTQTNSRKTLHVLHFLNKTQAFQV